MNEYPYPFSPDVMPAWHVMVFVLGACIGSFLNVCIWRIPRDESIVTAPSHCPKCGHDIAWYENIPLLSWLCLNGKCSKCKSPITFRYFGVELLTAVLFYILFYKVTFDHQPLSILIVYFGVTMLIVTTIFIDIEHFLIPDKTTYPVMLLGIAMSLVFPEIWGGSTTRLLSFVFSASGLLIGGGIMALMAIFGKMLFKVEALGWGDVKYIAAIGACLGLKACFFSVLFGSLTGALAGVGIMLFKHSNLKTAIPFGPFLATGTFIWMFYGERLTFLYLQLFRH